MIKRSFEHEQQMKDAVTTAINTITKGDVFASVSYSQSVSFEHDKLQSIDDTSHSSLGCRIFDKGRVGNSFINDPNNIEFLISNAVESARFGETIDFELAHQKSYNNIEWQNSPKNLNFSKQDLKDLASELLQTIKGFAPKAKVSTSAYNGFSQFTLHTTNGFQGGYETTGLGLQGGLFEIASDGSFLEIYEGYSFYETDIDFTKITEPLRERVERSRITSTLPQVGKLPVIFAPSAMDSILDPIEIAANGKTLYKGLSLFADKEHEQLFADNFSMIDDPFYYHGSATASFDDEGVIGKAIPIIQNGIFKNFIFDLAHAHKMNRQSTGHGTRSFQTLPVPSFTNRVIGLGDHSLDEMISSIGMGIYLQLSLGEGQSNTIAGDFSVLADSAFLIKDGKLQGRLKDIMLSGNAFELLKNIPMIENKLHKESSLFAPHLLLDNVTVSQK